MLCNLRRVLATSSSDKWPLETFNAKQINQINHINECLDLAQSLGNREVHVIVSGLSVFWEDKKANQYQLESLW